MEIFGMSPEMVTEAVMTHMVLTFALFRLLRVRESRRRLAFFWMPSLSLCDVVILYFLAHVDLYSEMVYRGVKWIVFLVLLASCLYFFEETLWKTLTAMFLSDLFAGFPGILRMLTCRVLGIPLSGLEAGDYPWGLKALYLFYAAAGYLLLRRWMKRYKESDGNVGVFWKLTALICLIPAFSSAFTGILQMKTDVSTLFYAGPLIAAPLEAAVFAGVMLLERSRRLRLENRYLRLQTSLFSEHGQVLREQRRMVEELADWLEGTRLKVPAAGMIVRHRARLAQSRYCENEMVSLAIGNKIGRCEEQGIRVEAETEQVRLPGWLKEIDLLTILYNLFDNAARAAGECEGEGRYIRLKLAAEPGRFTVFMENGRRGDRLGEAEDGSWEAAAGDRTAGGKPAGGKTDDGNFRETKRRKNGSGDRRRGEDGGSRESGRPGRGQGLGIIAETVRRYHGEIRRLEEAGRYAVELTLASG